MLYITTCHFPAIGSSDVTKFNTFKCKILKGKWGQYFLTWRKAISPATEGILSLSQTSGRSYGMHTLYLTNTLQGPISPYRNNTEVIKLEFWQVCFYVTKSQHSIRDLNFRKWKLNFINSSAVVLISDEIEAWQGAFKKFLLGLTTLAT